jgi:hypothetical protein
MVDGEKLKDLKAETSNLKPEDGKPRKTPRAVEG